MKVILVGTFLLGLVVTAMALQCKSCMHMETDNADVNEILDNAMSSAMAGGPIEYTTNCKSNAGSVKSMDCPSSGTPSCAAMKVNALYSAGDQDVAMVMHMRMCGGDEVSFTDTCKDLSEFEDQIRQGMGGGADMLKDMSGVACVCRGDNCNVMSSNALQLSGGGNNNVDASGSSTPVQTLFSVITLLAVALFF